MTMRLNSSIIDLGRDLMAACTPTSGTRGTGQLVVRASGNSSVYLPRNWALIPIVNGAAREDLLFKVAQGPNRARYPNGKRVKTSSDEPDTESWWTVQPGGTLVNIHSLIGGKRHNLPKGTKFIFDPYNPNLELSGVLQNDITNGADPTHFGGCMSMMQFEQMNGPQATLDAFRAELGELPAAVFVWSSTQPADGTTQSTFSRGDSRAGSQAIMVKENFDVFVISERLSSGHDRRSEGTKLLDDVTGWLTDRQAIDGQIFSSPGGIQVRGRNRIAGDNASYQSVYIYVVQVSITTQWAPYDDRTYSPWLRTHAETLTFEKDSNDERLVTTSQDVDMTTGSE